MESSVVLVAGVLTHVVTYGSWIKQDNSDLSHVVLVIPGNPGMVEYYEEFMATIHRELGGTPVWGLGHAGHDPGTEEVYILEDQIRHKIDFIETYIPSNTSLTLVAHSIGCKMVIEIMKRLEDSKRKFATSYMLFPAIEKMLEAPNGPYFWFLTEYAIWLPELFFGALSVLPEWILEHGVRWCLGGNEVSECCVTASLDLLNRRTIRNIFYMTHDELKTVRELDVEGINKFSHQLSFYYGKEDRWCPLSYYEHLKTAVPGVRAVVDQSGMQHAFVLKSSEDMGVLLASWIKEDTKNN